MLRFVLPSRQRPGFVHVRPARLAVLLAGFGLAGCSADITRFDSPLFLSEPGGGATAAIPRDGVYRGGGSARLGDAPAGGSAYAPPPRSRGDSVDVAALPEPAYQPAERAPLSQNQYQGQYQSQYQGQYQNQYQGQSQYQSQGYAPERQAYAPPSRKPAPPVEQPRYEPRMEAKAATAGETIEVQPGDTLYGLSRRHGVAISALMSANHLQDPNLKPGQKLVIPGASQAPQHHAALPKPLPKPEQPRVAAAAPAAASGQAPPHWTGTYTVKQGDSLYAVAIRHKVALAELQRANGITDARKVMPGTTLKVPAVTASVAPERMAPSAPQVMTDNTAVDTSPRVPPLRHTVINAGSGAPQAPQAEAPGKQAALAPSDAVVPRNEPEAQAAPEKAQPASAGHTVLPAGKFRWPAKGKVLSGFGARPDGSHNDGVNIAVPLGTDVQAAEAGVVAYAGNELKGYGNLVLLRHDNGWVSAYAHNDQILVKRGDKVKRGQVIGKAGNTGTVDQPQLHFELRQGAKPVDPLPHMERM
jgi:murein DD-endopeptidase MepM/ murein hydrolase activator NlpD